jgi:hypothetical protein
MGNFWQVRIHVLLPPRCDASLFAFPFHITMGNDGTAQHHEHLLSCVPNNP